MSDFYRIACQQCEQPIEFPSHGVGQTIDCPSCGTHLILVAPESAPVNTAPPPEVGTVRRSWRDDPATEKQLSYLRQFGYSPDSSITKGEASKFIETFEEDPGRVYLRDENWRREQEAAADAYDANTAWNLHEELNNAQRNLEAASREDRTDAKSDVNDCLRYRTDFWVSTFSAQNSDLSSQCLDLWDKFGRHYKKPTIKQIKAILEALDSHKPDWDKVCPASFFVRPAGRTDLWVEVPCRPGKGNC